MLVRVGFAIFLSFVVGFGCAVVPRYQREILADPAMDPAGTRMESRAVNKLHSSRETSGGGQGQPAGGGCNCGN